MASWEYPGSDPIDVHIDLPCGSIAITAEDTEAITVSLLPSRPGRDDDDLISQVAVRYADGRLDVTAPQHLGMLRHRSGLDLTIKVPQQSRCTVRTASCDIACIGQLGSLDARTASGDITAAVIDGPVELTVASGDVWLEEATRGIIIHSSSGDVRVMRAHGDVNIDAASGDIQIGTANGSVNARAATGDVRIDTFENGAVDVNTVSGDVAVGVAPGAGVYLDLSSFTGDIANDLDHCDDFGDADVNVKCTTVSGDVHISRAGGPQAGNRPKIKVKWNR